MQSQFSTSYHEFVSQAIVPASGNERSCGEREKKCEHPVNAIENLEKSSVEIAVQKWNTEKTTECAK